MDAGIGTEGEMSAVEKLTEERLAKEAERLNQELAPVLAQLPQYQAGEEISSHPDFISERAFNIGADRYQIQDQSHGKSKEAWGMDGYRIIKVSTSPQGTTMEHAFWGKGGKDGNGERVDSMAQYSVNNVRVSDNDPATITKIESLVNGLKAALPTSGTNSPA